MMIFLNFSGHQHSHDHDKDDDHHHHTTAVSSSFRDRIKIDADHMLAMCPILLYHIVNPTGNGCLNGSNFVDAELFVDPTADVAPKDKVWLYSTLSIIIVSLCGLLGVAVIPIMEKHFYHHVLQFLVALAVGTLAGDALLHLLPHAMMPAPGDDDIHQTMMLRGLAAVGGIVFFYFFERFLTMITEWRQRRQKQVKPSSRVRVQRDPESVSLNNGTATTCKHKYSSYPYCYGEIANETRDDHHEHQHVEGALLNNHADKIKLHDDHIILSPVEGKKLNGIGAEHQQNHIEPDNNTLTTSIDESSIEGSALCNNNKQVAVMEKKNKKDSVQEESYTIILR
jgi:ZIP Zinc transporter